jgi:Flp pilus assembly protein TadD
VFPAPSSLTLRLGDREQAMSFYQKAVALRPELAEAHFALGRLYDQNGKDEEAKLHYGKAIEISSATPKYHNNLAELFFRKGDYDRAIT